MPANPDTTPSYETFNQQWEVIYRLALDSWVDHVDGLDLRTFDLHAEGANTAMQISTLGIDGVAWRSPASVKATEFILHLVEKSEADLASRKEDISVIRQVVDENLYP